MVSAGCFDLHASQEGVVEIGEFEQGDVGGDFKEVFKEGQDAHCDNAGKESDEEADRDEFGDESGREIAQDAGHDGGEGGGKSGEESGTDQSGTGTDVVGIVGTDDPGKKGDEGEFNGVALGNTEEGGNDEGGEDSGRHTGQGRYENGGKGVGDEMGQDAEDAPVVDGDEFPDFEDQADRKEIDQETNRSDDKSAGAVGIVAKSLFEVEANRNEQEGGEDESLKEEGIEEEGVVSAF